MLYNSLSDKVLRLKRCNLLCFIKMNQMMTGVGITKSLKLFTFFLLLSYVWTSFGMFTCEAVDD